MLTNKLNEIKHSAPQAVTYTYRRNVFSTHKKEKILAYESVKLEGTYHA